MIYKLFSPKELAQFLKEDAVQSPQAPCIKVKGYKIYPKRKVGNDLVNIFDFGSTVFLESATLKRHRILLNDYLITVGCPSPADTTKLDWLTPVIYSVKNKSAEHDLRNYGVFDAGQIIVVDHKMIFLNAGRYPRFIVIIDGLLQELSVAQAEQALRNLYLTRKEVNALIQYYPDNGWEMHNGILINPLYLEVPSALQISLRNKGMKCHLPDWDYKKLYLILSQQPQKNEIRYISKEALFF